VSDGARDDRNGGGRSKVSELLRRAAVLVPRGLAHDARLDRRRVRPRPGIRAAVERVTGGLHGIRTPVDGDVPRRVEDCVVLNVGAHGGRRRILAGYNEQNEKALQPLHGASKLFTTWSSSER